MTAPVMNRRRLIVLLAVLFITSFAAGALIRVAVATQPTPRPQPTASTPSVDPLAEYKKIPPASCPPSIDPELREKFYRQGQCPTSK